MKLHPSTIFQVRNFYSTCRHGGWLSLMYSFSSHFFSIMIAYVSNDY